MNPGSRRIPQWIQWLLLIIATLTLLIPAFYNGYPLVYPDTGMYIDSGHRGEVPFGAPLMYGLFVRHISLSASLWIVTSVQALMTAGIISLLVAWFHKENYLLKSALLTAIIGLTTAASNFSSQIMPDFLTPLMILAMVIFLLYFERSKTILILMSLFILFSFAAHLSNPLIAPLIWIILLLGRLFRKDPLIKYKKLLWLGLVLVLSWLFLPTFNYMNGAGFVLSKSNNIRFMGRLIETGVLSEYLAENCDKKHYPICKFQDDFPMSSDYFLWQNSPLYNDAKTDAAVDSMWYAKSKEYDPLVKDILRSPKYFFRILGISIEETFRQLIRVTIEKLPPMMDGSPVLGQMEWRYPEETPAYSHSRQAKETQYFIIPGLIQLIASILSLLGIIIIFIVRKWRKQIKPGHLLLWLAITAGTVINAWACPLFSTPALRYQSRIAWLVPLFFMILLLTIIKKREHTGINQGSTE